MKTIDSPPLCTEIESSTRRIVDDVIRSRKTIRAFRPTPVPKALVTEILDVARCAPSNSNTQPWTVNVLQGEPKNRLTEALLLSHERDELPPSTHFPDDLPAVCKDRQADFGVRYYGVLEIDRDDAISRYRQTSRNYRFFDAPVGLIFSIDRCLTKHSWLDFGLFLQNVMLAAKARELDTCPQVSFVRHEPVIAQFLRLPPGQTVVCGMSMGYAEPGARLNHLDMPRMAVEDFATFAGFDGD
jgi:nitroreductase